MSLFVIIYFTLLALIFIKTFDDLILENYLTRLFRKESGNLPVLKKRSSIWLIAPLALLAFAIPYYRVSSSIPTILLVIGMLITGVIYYRTPKTQDLIPKHLKFYGMLIFGYLIFLSAHSLLISGDFQKLQLHALLPLYFLAFALLNNHDSTKVKFIAQFYVFGALCFVPFILVLASFQFDLLGWNAFYYTDLLEVVKANPITHSLYYNIAIVIVAQSIYHSKTIKEKIRPIAVMLVFIFMILLFGSKTGYLTACLSLTFIGVSLIDKKIIKLLFLLFIPVILVALYFKVPYVNKKVKGFKWQITRHDKIILEHRLPRTVIWPEAISLIKEKPLSGYGLGKSVEALSMRYSAIDYPKGIMHRFNVHNQFLESWLQVGITGILFWLLFVSYIIFLCIRNRDVWLAHFLFLLLAYLCVESLLESQMGSVAVAFFVANFIFSSKKRIT